MQSELSPDLPPEHAALHLAAIVEASDDAIISKTLDGHVLTWNPAAERVYGYSTAEARGKHMSFLQPPDRPDEESGILAQIAQGKHVDHFETVRMRKDGQLIRVSITISPIRDHTGTIIGASHISRDITERKRIEEQLRQTQKLESLGVLAGGVAHDFNNLLTGILGNTALVLEMLSTNHPGRALLRNALTASERAADLTKQLLAYAGKGRFVIEHVNLSALIEEITELIRTSIPKNVHLRLELSGDLPYIEADPSQLQQLIMNLIINGAEAVGEDKNGTVLVATEVQEVDEAYIRTTMGPKYDEIAPGTYVSLQVHDNGCGMDAATLARIFDPFFTTKFTGRGLGLAAVQGIVSSHRGAMKVYSQPGKGTTFKVLLPAATQAVLASTPAPTTEQLMGEATILVVDDEQIVRQTAKSMLERYGYTVLGAENGKEGVDLIRLLADKISLVVLDMTMPVMSGEETLRHMRTIKPDVKVILSSGYNEVEAIRRFTGKSLAGFVQKPYTAIQLAKAVRAALESKSS
jgi:PAS domain S-box-containing protein